MNDPAGAAAKPWPLFRSLQACQPRLLPGDLVAGLTLAAIAIPEQMATAQLGGFAPQTGFTAFLAGSLAFAVLGSNRFLSCGADSTITPIFAGSLVLMASAGSPDYLLLSACLAILVGALVLAAGIFKLGWIADLLSIPVTAGFLVGISVHILLSQLPAVMGLSAPDGPMLQKAAQLAAQAGHANPYTVVIALGVLGLVTFCDWRDARIPGALIALSLAGGAGAWFDLAAHGVPVLGALNSVKPHLALPLAAPERVLSIVPLGIIIAAIVMTQTAATTRAFPSKSGEPPDVARDFLGVGFGSILAGFAGAFPVNASPPRTAIAVQTGGKSQIAGLTAAAVVLGVMAGGGGLLRNIPQAALAGILLFIALKIIRFRQIAEIARQSPGELALIGATAVGIVAFPIAQGVGIGIALSLLHGIWRTSQTNLVIYERVPGTSIWWPASRGMKGEREPGILVAGFQAPLSFLNVYRFRRELLTLWAASPDLRLIVLEGAGLLDIDFTAAQVFREIVEKLQAGGVTFALARLESQRAESDMARLGLLGVIGAGHVYQSAEAACRAVGGVTASPAPLNAIMPQSALK